KSRVTRLLGIDGKPDELSGIPLQGLVGEDESPHGAARVSPGSPGLDEDRPFLSARLRQSFSVIVRDERQRLMTAAGNRRRSPRRPPRQRDREDCNPSHASDRNKVTLSKNSVSRAASPAFLVRSVEPPVGTAGGTPRRSALSASKLSVRSAWVQHFDERGIEGARSLLLDAPMRHDSSWRARGSSARPRGSSPPRP